MAMTLTAKFTQFKQIFLSWTLNFPVPRNAHAAQKIPLPVHPKPCYATQTTAGKRYFCNRCVLFYFVCALSARPWMFENDWISDVLAGAYLRLRCDSGNEMECPTLTDSDRPDGFGRSWKAPDNAGRTYLPELVPKCSESTSEYCQLHPSLHWILKIADIQSKEFFEVFYKPQATADITLRYS